MDASSRRPFRWALALGLVWGVCTGAQGAALPIPTDRPALDVLVEMVRATRSGELKVLGMLGNFRVLSRLTRVMSVNG